MKLNKIYITALALVAMISISCDPLEDEINEIEASNTEVQDLEYTLTDDDYDIADEACSCSGFGNFSSEEDVKANVPLILNANFPALGEGSTAIVNYDFFNGSSPDLRGDSTGYIVTDEEYDELGFGFGNFSNLEEDIPVYAEFKQPDAQDGDFMDIQHDFFSSSTGFVPDTLSRAVYSVAYGWLYAEILPEESYADFFGESPPDFSFEDEGEDKIPVYLKATKLFAEDGDIALVQYNYDNGPGTSKSVALFILDQGVWTLYGDKFQTVQQQLSFGHDGDNWVPDNTIKYTITAADFTEIGKAENGLGNPAALDNLNTFGNFGTQWSTPEIYEAIAFILKLNFPASEVGQKYLVTYNTFPAGDLQVLMILDASGEYVVVE